MCRNSGGGATELSGSEPAFCKATRPQLNLALTPQDAGFTASAVVNAATFTAGIAPGGVMAIFGTGLFGAGQATRVDMDGGANGTTSLRLLYTSAFQINAEVPAGIAPGVYTLRIQPHSVRHSSP